MAVYFSNKNIYAQLIDDSVGRTLVSASTLDSDLGVKGKANTDAAVKVGGMIAKRCTEANISSIVFDRGGFVYHGKVKALPDAAREGGLQF